MEAPKNYTEIELPYNMGNRNVFGENQFSIFKHETELKSLGKIFFKKEFHGPPTSAHGGAQSYVLDEVMGCTGWMHGFKVVAKSIEVEFYAPCPLETELTVLGEISNKNEKVLEIQAKIINKNEEIISKSKGVFRLIDKELHSYFFQS